jgi:hypothetical protein
LRRSFAVRDLIPLRSRLFSDSDFNTSLKPLAPEILYIDYRVVGLEFLLSPFGRRHFS